MPEQRVDTFAMVNPLTEPSSVSESRSDSEGSGTPNANIIPAADSVNVGMRTTTLPCYDWDVQGGSGTRTDNYAAGPTDHYDAGNTATRFQWSANNGPLVRWWETVLAAATQYTFSFYARALIAMTGANRPYYQVKDPNDGYQIDDTLWPTLAQGVDTRISFTFTTGASQDGAQINFLIGGGDAGDVVCWGAKLELGSAATGTPANLAPGQP